MYTLTDIKTSLPNYSFYHVPRLNSKDMVGLVFCCARGLKSQRIGGVMWNHLSIIDLSVSACNKPSFRLIVLYRLGACITKEVSYLLGITEDSCCMTADSC